METADKLAALAQIAHAFNARGVLWAAGASFALYAKGLAQDFRDLDLLTALDDFDAAADILISLGERLPSKAHPGFRSNRFARFAVRGVQVDLIAGFCIVHDGAEHPFLLTKACIDGAITVGGERVPLHSLAVWQQCYTLMGRADKARLIEEYLRAQGIKDC